MQTTEPDVSAATHPLPPPARRTLPLVAVGVAALGGYVLGGLLQTPAYADRTPPGILTTHHLEAPAVTIPHLGAAVIGAADGRYYVVGTSGVATPVKGVRPHLEPNRRDPDLFWR